MPVPRELPVFPPSGGSIRKSVLFDHRLQGLDRVGGLFDELKTRVVEGGIYILVTPAAGRREMDRFEFALRVRQSDFEFHLLSGRYRFVAYQHQAFGIDIDDMSQRDIFIKLPYPEVIDQMATLDGAPVTWLQRILLIVLTWPLYVHLFTPLIKGGLTVWNRLAIEHHIL